MGQRIGWLAVRGASIDDVAKTLGWTRSPDPRAGCPVAMLPSGWVVIETNHRADAGATNGRTLSMGREALSFWSDEDAVTSGLECFRDGTRAWKIGASGDDPGVVTIDGAVDPIVHEEAALAAERQRHEPEIEPLAHGYEAIATIAARLVDIGIETPRSAVVWESLVIPTVAIVHALAVDGGDEQRDASLANVLDAVAAFVEGSRASVALAVIVDGRRRTLRASHEAGELRVLVIGDDTRIGRRLDGSAITSDELVWLFSAFYPAGKRLAQYTWRLKPS